MSVRVSHAPAVGNPLTWWMPTGRGSGRPLPDGQRPRNSHDRAAGPNLRAMTSRRATSIISMHVAGRPCKDSSPDDTVVQIDIDGIAAGGVGIHCTTQMGTGSSQKFLPANGMPGWRLARCRAKYRRKPSPARPLVRSLRRFLSSFAIATDRYPSFLESVFPYNQGGGKS